MPYTMLPQSPLEFELIATENDITRCNILFFPLGDGRKNIVVLSIFLAPHLFDAYNFSPSENGGEMQKKILSQRAPSEKEVFNEDLW